MNHRFERVAIVGAGLVGAGWAIVFARAGQSVSIYDAQYAARASVLDWIADSLSDMERSGLVRDVPAIMARITISDSLEDAVSEADYIQESVFERVDVKRAISQAIGAAMRADAIVGSSSSGIPASEFTSDVAKRERFIIAHPVNPPHLIPLVEIVPAPWTDPSIAPVLRDFMESAGQKPIVLSREIEGFVLNRLQGALLNEAWALFDAGIASAADIDRSVSDGLGMRWSFMGPFETIDLNAPGGVTDYAERLGQLYHSIAMERQHPERWSPELITRVAAERRDALPLEDLASRCGWRDRMLMALTAHRTMTNGDAGA
ncbi:3-hydroxyacyl-CoA dehydrogenase [Sphingopyxis panaciterrae]|uniref:3-hydroxyacyl-CoA dehydrogenase n=1 Tax=Sphingopyxis panaciterrae TaxID=363841 RepID=UPI00141F25D0|nr:3-hydroxyacyl-CoA dehydrogenase [Sphingopyxis panaciterrae]NIJ37644.1 3-hydroxyacyl-CoA dehydrogenase [Sphingopyxis panaciterrae]